MNQLRFVNVDMDSVEGIERAKALNLAASGVSDIIISSMLLDSLEVFNNREYILLVDMMSLSLVQAYILSYLKTVCRKSCAAICSFSPSPRKSCIKILF
jgi:hypothetical protein